MDAMKDMFDKHFSEENLKSLSQRIGADLETTRKAVAAAVPTVMTAMSRKAAESKEGAQALLSSLDKDHDGSVLDDVGRQFRDGAIGGAALASQLFGEGQQAVQKGLAKTSGLTEDAMAKLMDTVTPVVAGAVSKAKSVQKLDADGLKTMLAAQAESVKKSVPELMGRVNKLLDRDGDGDVDADDLKGAFGKLFGKK